MGALTENNALFRSQPSRLSDPSLSLLLNCFTLLICTEEN